MQNMQNMNSALFFCILFCILCIFFCIYMQTPKPICKKNAKTQTNMQDSALSIFCILVIYMHSPLSDDVHLKGHVVCSHIQAVFWELRTTMHSFYARDTIWWCQFSKSAKFSETQYILRLVRTAGGMYSGWYVLVRKHTSFESRSICFPTPTSLHCALDLFLVPSGLLRGSLLRLSSTVRLGPSRRGLPRPTRNCHRDSHGLTSYTLLPRLPLASASAVLAQPKGTPDPLCLLNFCGMVGVGLPQPPPLSPCWGNPDMHEHVSPEICFCEYKQVQNSTYQCVLIHTAMNMCHGTYFYVQVFTSMSICAK
jgi:hypothetical protein